MRRIRAGQYSKNVLISRVNCIYDEGTRGVQMRTFVDVGITNVSGDLIPQQANLFGRRTFCSFSQI